MNLSIIVPCYNEEESVGLFYDKLTKLLKEDEITYEVLFVNDGSTDDTLLRLKELAKKDKNVKIISFSKNFGKEAAMLAGLENVSGKYVSIIDADLQQPVEVLVSIYKKLLDNEEYDIVAAYRETRNNDNKIKSLLTPLFYRIMNKTSEIKLLPGASDFRVFKSYVKDAIISLKERSRFLKGMFSWVGFNTIYVPYEPENRKYGTSKWSLLHLIKYAIGGIVSFSTFPLAVVFVIGAIMFLISLLNLLFNNLGIKTIILFISLLGLMIGTISLYLIRMYKNSLQRPHYIIKEKIGFKATKR